MDRAANDEMVQGYRDGYDLTAPEPSANRSYSYRHGFMVGRAEKAGSPAGDYASLIKAADLAMLSDMSLDDWVTPHPSPHASPSPVPSKSKTMTVSEWSPPERGVMAHCSRCGAAHFSTHLHRCEPTPAGVIGCPRCLDAKDRVVGINKCGQCGCAFKVRPSSGLRHALTTNGER